MLKIVISPGARSDIANIAAYTLATWGERQMARYLGGLHERFDTLARFPASGRRRDEIRKGYRSVTHGPHVVFYRVTERDLVIVRVLHGRMDPLHQFS